MDVNTGRVMAMQGGFSYEDSVFNRATQAARQPGSSFKPIAYVTAFSKGWNGATEVVDKPMSLPQGDGTMYVPRNYDGKFRGPVLLRKALDNSLNIPAVKTELRVGIPNVLSVARRMGVTHLTQPDDHYSLSLTLGGYEVTPIDMATGVATLADMGVRHTPAPVLSIKDSAGRDVFTYDPTKNAYQAVSPQVAFIMASIGARSELVNGWDCRVVPLCADLSNPASSRLIVATE